MKDRRILGVQLNAPPANLVYIATFYPSSAGNLICLNFAVNVSKVSYTKMLSSQLYQKRSMPDYNDSDYLVASI